MKDINLVKRIKQIEGQIKTLETMEGDDSLRKDWIEKYKLLRREYTRQLKTIKWRWILDGGNIEDYLN